MRKIILSVMALFTIAATSCQKKNELKQEPTNEKVPVLTTNSGQLSPGQLHNALMLEYYKEYGDINQQVGIDTVFERMANIGESVFGINTNRDTLTLYKNAAISTLSSIGAIDNNNRLKASSTLFYSVISYGNDINFKDALSVYTDSLLSNNSYGQSGGIDALEALQLNENESATRTYVLDIYGHAYFLYTNPVSDLFGYRDGGAVRAWKDAMGGRFGVALGASLGLGGAANEIIGCYMGAAFSATVLF